MFVLFPATSDISLPLFQFMCIFLCFFFLSLLYFISIGSSCCFCCFYLPPFSNLLFPAILDIFLPLFQFAFFMFFFFHPISLLLLFYISISFPLISLPSRILIHVSLFHVFSPVCFSCHLIFLLFFFSPIFFIQVIIFCSLGNIPSIILVPSFYIFFYPT